MCTVQFTKRVHLHGVSAALNVDVGNSGAEFSNYFLGLLRHFAALANIADEVYSEEASVLVLEVEPPEALAER